MADLPCGCRTAPKLRLCTYHEGRDDERDLIVRYLRRFEDKRVHQIVFDVADWIEAGAHLDGQDA